MPRPKGSKNKKTAVIIETVESIDERIATTEAAISTLTEELKAKKAELKELTKARPRPKSWPLRRRQRKIKRSSWML